MVKGMQIPKKVLVFAQWSRKGYAVFASLNKVVNIAHLSIELCKSALQGSDSQTYYDQRIAAEEDEVEEIEIRNSDLALALVVCNTSTAIEAHFCHSNSIQQHNIENPCFAARRAWVF
jgi:hypothetical protein